MSFPLSLHERDFMKLIILVRSISPTKKPVCQIILNNNNALLHVFKKVELKHWMEIYKENLLAQPINFSELHLSSKFWTRLPILISPNSFEDDKHFFGFGNKSFCNYFCHHFPSFYILSVHMC